MDRLWAPWRSHFLKQEKAYDGNFIVKSDQSKQDRENLVLKRTTHTIVMLNRYPYNNGHCLIAPRRETADFSSLSDAELLDIQKTIALVTRSLAQLVHCDGFNVGLNLGRAGGAGLPQHLHWHVVPRWHGDTNFMTVMADDRVIVQSLDEMWEQLSPLLA